MFQYRHREICDQESCSALWPKRVWLFSTARQWFPTSPLSLAAPMRFDGYSRNMFMSWLTMVSIAELIFGTCQLPCFPPPRLRMRLLDRPCVVLPKLPRNGSSLKLSTGFVGAKPLELAGSIFLLNRWCSVSKHSRAGSYKQVAETHDVEI
jgi:hypothetical protein